MRGVWSIGESEYTNQIKTQEKVKRKKKKRKKGIQIKTKSKDLFIFSQQGKMMIFFLCHHDKLVLWEKGRGLIKNRKDSADFIILTVQNVLIY